MPIRYFDNNATTRVSDDVLQSMLPWFVENYGNASSLHRLGESAAEALQTSRISVARLLGAGPAANLVFTSGGTESNNSAIRAALARHPLRRRIVASAVEHEAVLAPLAALEADGFEIVRLAPDREGRLHLEDFRDAVNESCALVAVMWANNETGALHDVAAIGEICAARGVPFHVDAVQVAGKLALNLAALPIDTLALSAHKLHGPKGIGALYLREPDGFEPLLRGGGQENERRAGTENIPAIVGFGRAAEAARAWIHAGGPAEVARLRDRLEQAITRELPGSRVHAAGVARTCNTSNLGFDRVSGEALVLLLSEEGVCASAGSACASSRHAPSHVLLAMGLGERAASSSLRLSLSRETTAEEVDFVAGAVVRSVASLRALAVG